MRVNKRVLLVVGTLALLMTSCTVGTDVSECLEGAGEPADFWSGIWDGWILGFNLISKIWNEDAVIYQINNNGGAYDVGFYLGLGGEVAFVNLFSRRRKND